MDKKFDLKSGMLKAGDVTTNVAIDGAAAGAGATVATYCIRHDVCNQMDKSIIVGAVAGTGTFCVVRGTLRKVKAGIVGLFSKDKKAKAGEQTQVTPQTMGQTVNPK